MKKGVLFFAVVLILSSIISCNRSSLKTKTEEKAQQEKAPCKYLFGICVDSLDVTEYVIKPGESLSVIFSKFGFSPAYIDQISRTCSDIMNPRKIVAGKSYYVFTTQDSIAAVRYFVFANSSTDFPVIDLSIKDTIQTSVYCKPVTYMKEYTEGVINSSLWNTIKDNGGDPLLALKLSDIYAWQIDFFDIREGDAFKVMYEVAYIDDTIPLAINKINGAVFSHKNIDYYAIPFEQDSILEFFDLEGNSLRKAFLKAPLDYFRITSRFSNARFHPVLKRYRSHHGVDYAAPIGTPVKTIGDGTVIAKGFQKGGGGNYLKVKHNATYTTTYMHLKGFAKGINVGSRVQQGQVIGYVGSTGLSTGPHLDFRVHKNGSPIDPLKMESPPSLPVKEELRSTFDSVKIKVVREIEWESENLVTTHPPLQEDFTAKEPQR